MITRDAVDLDRRFEEAMSGHAVEIARRQADGGWLFDGHAVGDRCGRMIMPRDDDWIARELLGG